MTGRAQVWYAEHAAPGTKLGEGIERAKNSPAGRAYGRLQDAEALRSAHEKLADAFIRSLNRQEICILGAFPKIRATRSSEALSRIRERLRS